MSKSRNHRVSEKILKPQRFTVRHIKIEMAKIKDKERILKAAREKHLVMSKGTPIKVPAVFSAENLQTRREWQHI